MNFSGVSDYAPSPAPAERDYSAINKECACLSLRKVTRAATQLFDHMLEPAGVRSTQFTLLVSLASANAKTLTEMASSLVMDRTTLTRNLKPLEKMGLIESVTPLDKRSKSYRLSEKGQSVLVQGVPLWERAQRQLIQSVGEEKFQMLFGDIKNLTNKIIDL